MSSSSSSSNPSRLTERQLNGHPPLWRGLLSAVMIALALSPVAWRLLLATRADTIRGDAEAGDLGGHPVVLRYMSWGNPQQLQVERDLVHRFNEQCKAQGKHIRVEATMPPAGGYTQKMQLMLASGTAPDVMRCDQYYFSGLAQRGYFRSLSDLIENDPDYKLSDFADSAIRECKWNGQMHAVNVIFGGVVCYYNRDLFERAGLRSPYDLWKRGEWTWERFEDYAQRLTERDGSGRTNVYGFLMTSNQGSPAPWLWAQWVWRFRGRILSDDKSQCLLDSPESIAAFQNLHDMLWVQRVCPTPADAAASAFTFESGNIAMEFQWAGQSPRYRENIKDFRWDVAPVPQNPDASGRFTLVKGNQLVMKANCEHPREAWEFMKFMVSPGTEILLNGDALRRGVPTRTALLSREEFTKSTKAPYHSDVFKFLFDKPRALPIDPAWGSWTVVAQRFFSPFFLDSKADARAMLTLAVAAINNDLKSERQRMERYREPSAPESVSSAERLPPSPCTQGEGGGEGTREIRTVWNQPSTLSPTLSLRTGRGSVAPGVSDAR